MPDKRKKPANKSRRKPPTASRAPRARFSLLRWLSYWSAVLVLWGGIAAALLLAWFAYDLPDTDMLGRGRTSTGITFLGANGETIGTRGDIVGATVRLHEIPDYLIEAVIATEDRRFYSHIGVDPWGLLRAAWANLRAGRIVQGGSTITQQLAKNVFLTPERSIRRKAQELLLAVWLEQQYSKDEILTLYLNRVYFGSGTYGISAAAQKYFGKSVGALDLSEAAMLAGLLKAPSRYAPTRDLALARARANQVLANMVDAGFLTGDGASAASRRPATVRASGGAYGVQYYLDWVVDRLPDYIGRPDADLIVETTLDPRLQALAEEKMAAAFAKAGTAARVGQGAMVVLAPDGAVRAMVGGRSYAKSQFNRATQARRQPGSAFKPFVYLTALERGMTPDTMMRDSPLIFGDWQPRNFSGKFAGEVSLEVALRDSINTVAVKVSEKAGRHRVIDTAHRLGILSDLQPTPAIALGASEVALLELTGAYAPFANGGRAVLPHGIREVKTAAGRVLYQRHGAGGGQVIARHDLDAMNRMLMTALRSGTGKAARLPGRVAAGKTGTSQDFRDAWFIGYTPQLVTGIWFGNDDGRPMRRVTGGGLPALTWQHFMSEALAPMPSTAFPDGRAEGGDLISRIFRALGGDT